VSLASPPDDNSVHTSQQLKPLITPPQKTAEYCNGHVGLSLCPHAYLSNHISKLHRFSVHANYNTTMAQSSSGGVVIRYAVRVLCMTSCLHVMTGLGNIKKT